MYLIIIMIIVLALLHCTMNNELCNLNPFYSTCFIPYRALTQAHSNLQYEYQFVSKNFIPDSCHLWNDCSMYESLYK